MTRLPLLLCHKKYPPYFKSIFYILINWLVEYLTAGIKNAEYQLIVNIVVERQNKLQDIKQNIKSKINDIDQMLNDLNSDKNTLNKADDINEIIEINQLDVVDLLNNILN